MEINFLLFCLLQLINFICSFYFIINNIQFSFQYNGNVLGPDDDDNSL
jgi:hypothetical protein